MYSRFQTKPFRIACFLLMCAAVVLLNGCARQPTPNAYEPPGFWFGLLHGFLIFFSFIGSLFTDVRIYAFPNSGVLYDFGYLIGAGLSFAGALFTLASLTE